MRRTRLALDLSSLLWTCLRTGKDAEGKEVEHNGKKVWVNTAMYAYEFAVNSVVAALKELDLTPIDMIIVREGLMSKSPRIAIFPEYKAGRDDKPNEEYEQFQNLRERFCDVFRNLGAVVVCQDRAEGDDVLGWLATNTRAPLVIMTNDNDMQVLNGTNNHGAVVAVRVNGIIGNNKYGTFPFKYTTLYKATVGDSSDGISGIPRFGVKAWEQLETRFGVSGLEMLDGFCRAGSVDDLHNDAQQDAFVKKIYDGGADMIRSFKLAKLYPEWVDTMADPLQWAPGMTSNTDDERLKPWAAARRLVTTKNWDAFTAWALPHIKARPWLALDIETSTPDESDDWLAAQEDPDGVDVIGSELTGMSLTFGANMQYTVYISVDHKDTDNVSSEMVRDFVAQIAKQGTRIVIHNTMFEGPVLFNVWGEHWKDNGYQGLLPNWYDTKFAASYVDENDKLGLKHLSKRWLGYNQVDYKTTTTLEGPFADDSGGRYVGEIKKFQGELPVTIGDTPYIDDRPFELVETRQFKMRELTAQHVFDYACDDTVCTAALYNFFTLFMELEGTDAVLEDVELDASYAHAQSFVHGFSISMAKLSELEQIDKKTADAAMDVLSTYLISKGWDGTVCPVYTAPLSAPHIKEAYQIVMGEPLATAVRTPSKLVGMIANPLLAGCLRLAVETGDVTSLNTLVRNKFDGKPKFNAGSPVQMQRLMYEVMECPVRVNNPPTDAMKAKGQYTGTPSTDALAIAYALRDMADNEQVTSALQALQLIKMVQIRNGLYYRPYPRFIHWKTGRIHAGHNQCATNTRRASSSRPNVQQWPKHPKVEGQPARFREVVVPHKKNAIIISMDFAAQELRVIADYSRDTNMLDCFIGDSLKDMHILTGLEIANREGRGWSYHSFCEYYGDTESEFHKACKAYRALGKRTNFTTEFGAQAPKLAATLMVEEALAQLYIDAREEAFPEAKEWKQTVISEAKGCGFVRTKLGAKRHLRNAFMSSNRRESSKAERQSVNTKIQGSSAEMTKKAEGRIFAERLTARFDAEIIGPIHDEIVASCAVEDAVEFIKAMHGCMVAPYADMYVPIESSISFGPNFGHQIEIGSVPSDEAIEKGLKQLKEVA